MMRAALTSSAWHCRLSHRGVLAVEGRDSRKLLQGLVTSDVTELDAAPQYTAFLDAKGRVLLDAFLVSGTDGSVMIDLEASALPMLEKHLRRYKLRSKVTFTDVSTSVFIDALCGLDAGGGEAANTRPPCEGGLWADPRLPALGYRALRREVDAPAMPAGSVEAPAELHALQLAILGVPNGAVDAPTGEALPLEMNLELLNGVSFRKGCYLGQELTARTHFRGVIRKRLLPVVAAELLQPHDTVTPPEADELPFTSAQCPALAHLPSEERSLAARILAAELGPAAADGRGGNDRALEPSAAPAIGTSLTLEGKPVAKLRSFDPARGLGECDCCASHACTPPLLQPLLTPCHHCHHCHHCRCRRCDRCDHCDRQSSLLPLLASSR